MPSVYDLKPKFQQFLRPLVQRLAEKGITANHVTLAAVVLSLVAGGAIALFSAQPEILLSIPVVLFLRMALNAIDGMLAREHHMASSLGAILNELGDVLSDAALYLPLALVPGIFAPWVVVMVLLAVISEMAGVIAVQIGASRRYEGPMGKSDRALWIGCISLVLGLGARPDMWVDVVLMIIVALLGLTILNRSRRALEEIRGA